MRHRELQNLFARIVMASVPVPLALAAQGCGGTSVDDSGGASGSGAGSSATGGLPDAGVGGSSGGAAGQPAERAGMGGAAAGHTSSQAGHGGLQGTAGFFGTVVMMGGAGGMGGASETGGIQGTAGFFGTVVMMSGAGGMGAGERVACPDAAGEGGEGGAPMANGGSSAGVPMGLLPCGASFCVPAPGLMPGDAVSSADCPQYCGGGLAGACIRADSDDAIVKCFIACTGRRPTGLVETSPPPGSDLAVYFSAMAQLEAASVPAFRALGRELAAYGAPRSLRRCARRAARDEIRHARLTRDLAVHFGGRYAPPRLTPKSAPSLEFMATENATEGCVRETFGALLATWQARAARHPAVRRAMQQIARDETRHAALAWRIARWAERRLDVAARERVRAARLAAVDALVAELAYPETPALRSIAGVPSVREARALAHQLAHALWEKEHA